MTARKKPPARSGLLIDVVRVISMGHDRTTGGGALRFRDEQGRTVAVRLRSRQIETLANGVVGLAERIAR